MNYLLILLVDEDFAYHHPQANISISSVFEMKDCIQVQLIANGKVLFIEREGYQIQLLNWQGEILHHINHSETILVHLQAKPIELKLSTIANHDGQNLDSPASPPIELKVLSLSDGSLICLQQRQGGCLEISPRVKLVMHSLKAIYTNGYVYQPTCLTHSSEGQSIHQLWGSFHIASHQFLKECTLSILLFDIQYLDNSKLIFTYVNDKKLKDNFLWDHLKKCSLQVLHLIQGLILNK